MCGICGKFAFDGTPVGSDLIRKMCQSLQHRGPDDEGVYVDGCIGLGQRRLSIIDLSPKATAPLSNEDGTTWLVFDGAIFNFQELRRDLEACGHVFKTRRDTETIIHAYEEYGHGCLAHFNGMFAFALWDARLKELFCARDRLGKKPFCYTHDGRCLRLGSEIKAITADPEFQVEPDYGVLDVYLSYGYIPSPLSAFKAVSKLMPGHYLVCNADGNLRTERYWSPPWFRAKSTASVEEIKEELKTRLREAVRLRMIADVPLGAFLSGGIDSTTIVALMAQESCKPVKTFSIGFKDDAFNELLYARSLAERYGTEHHELILEPDAAEVLPLLVRHYNEPYADSSAVPTYYVCKLSREHVTVALTGDGGDESFAGYRRYGTMQGWWRWSGLLRPLRPFLRTAEWGLSRLPYHRLLGRMSRGAYMLGHDLVDQYRLQMSAGLKPQEKMKLYSNEFWRRIAERPIHDPIAAFSDVPDMTAIEFCMSHDQHFNLPDELMVKTDIASMANGLEVRCPLLDYQMVEFAGKIPVELRWRNGLGKWIFREAFGDLLPLEVLGKPKSGFAIPLGSWLRGELNSFLHDCLLDTKAKNRGLFDHQEMARMIGEHEQGIRSWENRLWALLMLEMWFREFVDGITGRTG